MRKCRVLALVISIVVAVSAGCGQDKKNAAPKDAKTKGIEAAVIWYNALLADGYRGLRMESLMKVATQHLAMKAYFHMASLGEAGLKMDASLRKIEFGKVTDIDQDKIEVSTEEIWDYTYWDIKTGERRLDNSINYDMRYKLKRADDKWWIFDIVVKERAEGKDSSFLFQRPPGVRQGEPANGQGADREVVSESSHH